MNNKKTLLIAGEAGTGKSFSLKTLRNPERVLYLDVEGKGLPFFGCKFVHIPITGTQDLDAVLFQLQNNEEKSVKYDTLVIDSITALFHLFIDQYTKEDEHKGEKSSGQRFWEEYNGYFRKLLTRTLPSLKQNIVCIGHNFLTQYEIENKIYSVYCCVAHAQINKSGLESFFNFVLHSKLISVKELKDGGYNMDYLHISEDDELDGYKRVFKTIGDTAIEKIRSPDSKFWARNERFIDNDLQLVFDLYDKKLEEAYK